MTRRRRTREPDKRLDWRDPNMPVLRAMDTGMEALSPEDESAYSADVMARSLEPTWRNDPTYNLAKRQEAQMIDRDILDVATPSMRPKWIGRTKPMTADETAVLLMAVNADPLRYRDVYDLYGERAWSLLKALKAQGAIDHPGYNRWQITEKGRIAAALATHQQGRR